MATKAAKRRKSSSRTSTASSSSSKRAPREVKDGGAIADNRAAVGKKGAGVQGGLVDQMTRRSPADAMEGHFVTVDRTHSGLSKEAKEALGGLDGYGVYTEPAEVDGKGFPTSAVVILRNSGNQRVVVPYDALAPSDASRRS